MMKSKPLGIPAAYPIKLHSVKRLIIALVACLAAFAPLTSAGAQQKGLEVYHAGSLSKAMADIGKAFTQQTGVTVVLTGSGSGALRQRIEQGERPGVFASADMGNPARLAEKGLAEPPTPFTGNALCVLAKKSVGVTPANVVEKLMDAKVKVGTSTPMLDPGGDYTWMFFDKAEATKKGAAAALKAKAIKLVGDPALPMPPKDYPRGQVAWHMEEGRADVFLVYVTTAMLTQKEMEGLEIVELPKDLAVGARYGLTVITGAAPVAGDFKAFVLGAKGQEILKGYGFRPQ